MTCNTRFLLAQAVTIEACLWDDKNGDGIENNGEGALKKTVAINLYDASNDDTPERSVVTNPDDGCFEIEDVRPGDYIIEAVPGSDLLFAPQDQGDDDTIDSDVDQETGRAYVTITSGLELNFGVGLRIAMYYPDWIHETQVCTNDALEPTFMLRIQADNYIYNSKEECCQMHFWWRIAQCMDNEVSAVKAFLISCETECRHRSMSCN